MKHEIKIYKAKFKTAGITADEILREYDDSIGPAPTTEEIELWQRTLNVIDGTELFITNSFSSSDDRYVIISWPNESHEKMMEFVYAAEQDSMFGLYQDEREQFVKDWKAEEYEPSGSLTVSASDVEIIREMKKIK